MLEPSFFVGQVLSGLTAAMFLFVVASGLSVVFGVLRNQLGSVTGSNFEVIRMDGLRQ